jgi:DNA polymerase III subunit delta'
MAWQDLYGHDRIAAQFRRAAERGRLGGSFLFVGPPGVGKRTFAVKMAKSLLCREHGEDVFDACGRCPSCVQVEAGTHPDLLTVAKPADRAQFPLEILIGDKENRMREGLCRDISLRPFMGGRKVAIIDDADYFGRECANCLLKTLEEPPPKSILILIGTTPARQLPTIRSRCRVIRFLPLEPECIARILLEQGIVSDEDEAMEIAAQSEGSLTKAAELADEELREFRRVLLRQLTDIPLNCLEVSTLVLKFVEKAGIESAKRRRRLHEIVRFATDFYRGLLLRASGRGDGLDPDLAGALDLAVRGAPVDPVRTADRVERCIEAETQIDRYVQQPNLVESWMNDLA